MSDTPPLPFPEDRIVRSPDEAGADVIVLPCVTSHDIPPSRVLSAAARASFDRVIVIGVLDDGSEYIASSMASAPECLWLLERAKSELMK